MTMAVDNPLFLLCSFTGGIHLKGKIKLVPKKGSTPKDALPFFCTGCH